MSTDDVVRHLDQLASGFQKSQILFTALRAGVFEELRHPKDAVSLAQAVGWDRRAARMLLDALVALRLVSKAGGQYQNAQAIEQCLVRGAPQDQRNIMTHRANSWEGWSQLDAALRAGRSVIKAERARNPEELRAFILGMADIGCTSAAAMLEIVDLSGYRHMLDIGTGPGTYPITFMKAHADLRATLFDLPEVLPITKEQVDAAGLSERVSYREGDLNSDTLGEGYDFIHISNIVHGHSPAVNTDLVQRCFDALDPGGMILIKDFLVEPERQGPPFSLLFALQMLVHTEAGDVYTRADAQTWTDAAGFEAGTCIDLTSDSRLWIARKP